MFSLTATLSLWESRTRGLGTGGYAQVMPGVRHPAERDLGEDRYGGRFVRQGGLLSIANQEPNWLRNPSPLGLILVI